MSRAVAPSVHFVVGAFSDVASGLDPTGTVSSSIFTVDSVARASTQDTAISAVAPAGTPLKRYDDDATALQALISGQVQAMGASNTILAQLNKDYPQLNMEPKLTLEV